MKSYFAKVCERVILRKPRSGARRLWRSQPVSTIEVELLESRRLMSVVTVSPASFYVAENGTNGTIIGTVLASDSTTGRTVAFTITGGNTETIGGVVKPRSRSTPRQE